jgi:hypothetical protein
VHAATQIGINYFRKDYSMTKPNLDRLVDCPGISQHPMTLRDAIQRIRDIRGEPNAAIAARLIAWPDQLPVLEEVWRVA